MRQLAIALAAMLTLVLGGCGDDASDQQAAVAATASTPAEPSPTPTPIDTDGDGQQDDVDADPNDPSVLDESDLYEFGEDIPDSDPKTISPEERAFLTGFDFN